MLNHRRESRIVALIAAFVLLAGAVTAPRRARAAGNPNQFGGQDRADAASKMIVLGVQQGISSLPPTSGQSFTYEFDQKLSTYVSSERLGPTSFRSPQTIGAGKFSFRFATSYFELADTKVPIPYLISSTNSPGTIPATTPLGVAEVGLRADAKVGLINLSLNYGISNRVEMMLNLPVVVVDAQASQIFTSSQASGPAQQAPLSGPQIQFDPVTGKPDVPGTVGLLHQALNANLLHLRQESFSNLGFDFNDGTHVGVGRISFGIKGLLYAGNTFQLAAVQEFYLSSPSEREFAGSNSAAVLPRLVGAFRLADPVKLHVDAGYDYDFDSDELRRFVWNFGPSLAWGWATFDAGVGGSKFNKGITWTPTTASFVNAAGSPGTIQVEGDNRFGSNFVDALGGVKVRLNDRSVISGAVNVPLNNEGFRAAAVGTLAVEVYF